MYSEELSYPNIFCGESRPQNKERYVKSFYSEICKSELKRTDRRVAQDPDNMFYKVKKLQMKCLLDKVQFALRKGKVDNWNNLNAGSLKDINTIQSIIHDDSAYRFMRNVRGSPAYFQLLAKDLFAMIRLLGPATFFCSFSAAETSWNHLLRILGQIIEKRTYTDEELEDLTFEQKCKWIKSEPVICAWHFEFQVQEFMKFLKSEHNPIGKISDFSYRVEFQQRGSPHIHILIWNDSAPIYDEEQDPIKVIKYIDKYITCKNDPEIKDLVKSQVHRHTHTCRKSKHKTCRFNYPKPPMSETRLLKPYDGNNEKENKKLQNDYVNIQCELKNMKNGEDIDIKTFLERISLSEEAYILAIRSKLDTNTIFLKRNPNEININAYNKNLLKAWRANMDIQFVLDVYACARYIAAYVTKSQRGMSELMRKASEEAKRETGNDLKKQFRIIANKFINSVEISAQEATYLLLQLPLKRSSRQVFFLNTSPPKDRIFLLKPQHVIDSLQDEDPNIKVDSIVDKYEARPQNLENVSFAEFASNYEEIRQPIYSRSKWKNASDGLLHEHFDAVDNADDTDDAGDSAAAAVVVVVYG